MRRQHSYHPWDPRPPCRVFALVAKPWEPRLPAGRSSALVAKRHPNLAHQSLRPLLSSDTCYRNRLFVNMLPPTCSINRPFVNRSVEAKGQSFLRPVPNSPAFEGIGPEPLAQSSIRRGAAEAGLAGDEIPGQTIPHAPASRSERRFRCARTISVFRPAVALRRPQNRAPAPLSPEVPS